MKTENKLKELKVALDTATQAHNAACVAWNASWDAYNAAWVDYDVAKGEQNE